MCASHASSEVILARCGFSSTSSTGPILRWRFNASRMAARSPGAHIAQVEDNLHLSLTFCGKASECFPLRWSSKSLMSSMLVRHVVGFRRGCPKHPWSKETKPIPWYLSSCINSGHAQKLGLSSSRACGTYVNGSCGLSNRKAVRTRCLSRHSSDLMNSPTCFSSSAASESAKFFYLSVKPGNPYLSWKRPRSGLGPGCFCLSRLTVRHGGPPIMANNFPRLASFHKKLQVPGL